MPRTPKDQLPLATDPLGEQMLLGYDKYCNLCDWLNSIFVKEDKALVEGFPLPLLSFDEMVNLFSLRTLILPGGALESLEELGEEIKYIQNNKPVSLKRIQIAFSQIFEDIENLINESLSRLVESRFQELEKLFWNAFLHLYNLADLIEANESILKLSKYVMFFYELHLDE